MNIGSLLSHAANFGVAASTAASLSDRLAGKKKGKRTVKRAAKNPFTGQIEIPQEIIDRFGEDYINAIFDAENVPEYLTALSDAALAENDYWSYNDFQTLLGLVRVAEARRNGMFDAESIRQAKRVQTTGYCVGCQVQYGNTEGVVTQSFRDSEGVQWFEVKPQRGGKVAVPASDVRILHNPDCTENPSAAYINMLSKKVSEAHRKLAQTGKASDRKRFESIYNELQRVIAENPSYRVHLEVPAVRESVEVSAITQGGAFRKGKRQLRSHLKTHPKWSVERNPSINEYARYIAEQYYNEFGSKSLDPEWTGTAYSDLGNEKQAKISWSDFHKLVQEKLYNIVESEENPLRHGARHASENIRELHHGPQHTRTMRKYGKDAAHRQAIAAGLHAAGVSRNPNYMFAFYLKDQDVNKTEPVVYITVPASDSDEAFEKADEQLKQAGFVDGVIFLHDIDEKNPSGKGKRKSLPVALVLNPDETLQKLYDKYNKADDEFNRVVDNYSPTDKSYNEKVNRALHKRQKLLTNIQRYRQKHQKRNGAEIHPSVKSKLNAISAEFHGPNNHMKGRASHHYISDHVKARNFSRAGSATVIKLVNDATGEHAAPDHWCEECALFPNPKTSVLGISTGKHVQLMGNGVHALGRRIKRNLDRMDEAELAEMGVKRERGGGYDLGKADTQVYTCVEKWADVDDPDLINYYHEWAEETRELEDKPNAKIDENGMLYLSGGKHTVTKAGIEN